MKVSLIFLLLVPVQQVLSTSTTEQRSTAAVTGNETSVAVVANANENDNYYYHGFCDESKCISPAFDKEEAYESVYTSNCYAGTNNSFIVDPMLCSFGYKPTIVGKTGATFNYYTCCLPISNDDDDSSLSELVTEIRTGATILTTTRDFSDVTRHCGDYITVDRNNTPFTCSIDDDDDDADDRQYPHVTMDVITKDNDKTSYTCCDSILTNKTTMHTIAVSVTKNLQEEECIYTTNSKVPYNTYGKLFAMKCDNNQIGLTNVEFPFPKPTERFGTLNDYGYFYQCCRTGPGQHFIQDSAFNWTLYPQIIISCISSFISALLAVALTIPLWRWLQYKKGNPSTLTKRQRQQQQQQQHNNNNQSSSSQHQQTEYSSYNLYLVFLSLPDFILNVYFGYKYVQYASGNYDTYHMTAPHIIANVEDQVVVLRESTIVRSCACANLYLNAIVAYEVLTLLTDSYQRKHHTPPSIKRVTLQASLVYVITIIISLGHFYGCKKLLSDDDNLEYVLGSLILELVISLVFVFGIPLAYLIYVCIVIWRKKLMPDVEGRLKELVRRLLTVNVYSLNLCSCSCS